MTDPAGLRWSECPACGKVLETAIGEPLAGTICRKHPSSVPVRHEREARKVAAKVLRMGPGERRLEGGTPHLPNRRAHAPGEEEAVGQRAVPYGALSHPCRREAAG